METKMALNRRNVLKIIGGGTILAAGGIGAFVTTRTPTAALAPWTNAGSYEEPRKRALSYALLAPNPHNRQPWMVDLSEPEKVTIHRDKERNLPHTDPLDRQLTIGMGCFLELLKIAASQTGHSVTYDLFPDGEDGPVATAHFSSGDSPDPMFAHVMARRTCKEPFEDRKIPAEMAAALASHATIITEKTEVETLIKLAWAAWLTEWETPRTRKESVDLMRMGKSEIIANPDGIDLGGGFLESLMAVGGLSREAMMDTKSISYGQSVSMYQETLHATPAFAVQVSDGNSRADQIEAGAKWLRLNLATTGLGPLPLPVAGCRNCRVF